MSVQERPRRQQQSQHDQEQERLARVEHRHAEALCRPEFEKVLSFREWCALCGFSVDTGRRLVASGHGPPVVQLSVRRIGVRLGDHARWSASRVHGAV
jgi:hypothetical protein